MAVPPVATGLAVHLAASAPALAAGLAVSAFNAGIALGSWIGGYALDSSLGPTGPALIGTIMTGIGLIALLALAAAGPTTPVPTSGHDDLIPVTSYHSAGAARSCPSL
jgi:predicted MFS family arabinose efflux permease